MPDFICIGVPYFLGQRLDERTEVEAVRRSGFAQDIGAEWIDLALDDAHSPDPITAVNHALADIIAAHRDRVPLMFASDCVSAIGAVKGLMSDAGLGVVWLDAHGDFNTPETTPSGFLGGMPLAMLVGRGEQRLMEGVGLEPLNEGDVILSDARDLDPGEAVALGGSTVTHLPSLLDLLTAPLPDKPLYVHLDVDVVNTDEMPAVGYPARGGPSLADTVRVVRRLAQDGRVAGVLFSLWNGNLASDERPLQATLRLARALVDGLRA